MAECMLCGRPLPVVTVGPLSDFCDHCRALRSPVARQPRFPATASLLAQVFSSPTWVLITLNVAVFLLLMGRGMPLWSPTGQQVIRAGGNYGPLTLGPQPWRLLTAVFIHVGIVHLLVNMWTLLNVGLLAERLYGRGAFVFVYLSTGIAGNVASIFHNPYVISAGASGALFGVAGALITTLHADQVPAPRHTVRQLLISLIVFSAFSLAYGFYTERIDNAAHLGGLLLGLGLGAGLGHHLGPSARARAFRKQLFTMAAVVVVLTAVLVFRLNGYVATLERARIALSSGKRDQGIAILKQLSAARANDPLIHRALGEAYLTQGELPNAESEFKKATDLNARDFRNWNNLAQVYIVQKRWDDAVRAFTRSTELAPGNAGPWLELGFACQRLDKHKEAVAAFSRTLQIDPSQPLAWYSLGLSQMSLKQYEEAARAFQRAAEFAPNDANVQTWLGNALQAAGRQREAEQAFARAASAKRNAARRTALPDRK